MKKIMIAAVAVMLGIAANAASVAWSLTTITDSPDAAKAAGWVAYALDGSDYAAFTALSGDQVAAFVLDNAIASGNTVVSRGNVSTSFTGGNFASGSTTSTFLVIFDNANAANADNFAYTATGSAAIPESGANGNMNFGTFESATAATGGWQSTDVPEPTSGLLLLVGVAGLALRRRRA